MEWFDPYGAGIMAVIMIPNIVYAVRNKNAFKNKWSSRAAEIVEQIGRAGCFAFMILDIPGTCFGRIEGPVLAAYLAVDIILTALYCAVWVVCRKNNTVFRALALSVIPSALFLFSGIMKGSILLTVSSLLFAPSHILISYKNAG